MIHEFATTGYLFPKCFMLVEGKLILTMCADESLTTPNGQAELVRILKEYSKNPKVEAIGFIFEAYMSSLPKNSKESRLIEKGLMRVSESSSRKTILTMVFSTPTSEEIIWCDVDEQAKTIGNPTVSYDKKIIGIYSGLFPQAA